MLRTIIRLENLKVVKLFGARHGFKVCTGTRYLGVYVWDDKSKRYWLRERTLTWEKNIITISKTAGKYTQESYAVVVRAIQSEWICLQRFTWDTGYAFAAVEKMIRETFLPHLFFGKTKIFLTIIRSLSTMPVNKYGLGLMNPATSA